MAKSCTKQDSCEPLNRAKRGVIELGDKLVQVEGLRRIAEEKALMDHLTGAYNRRILDDKWNELASELTRFGFDSCLLFFDVDKFKKFNDKYGENTGDKVLEAIVGAIKPMLRPYDVIIKYGGEEFIILLPKINFVNKEIVPNEKSIRNAHAIGERIREKVESIRMTPYGTDERVGVTVSIGVTLLSEANDLNQLVQNANDAERAAKDAGRNKTYIFYEGKVDEKPPQS
ncbi:GGDEF domain-containing protein [Candidatus Micrarchaeota archaeon]|nr:GGDEF domain-containing protein [Candidatus Micrarchaeota archaeon]